MKLATTYLGLPLKNPFMPGASPLADCLDTVLELEDAGASAIVMRSLFEEQLRTPKLGFTHATPMRDAEAAGVSHFPIVDEFALAPDSYLEQVRRIRARVAVPVIASINGTTTEKWLGYARLLQKAGADAIELNFYYIPTSSLEDATMVERRLLDVVAVLKESVAVPIAVKLSPFYSALPNLATRLEAIGAHGLVVFNRFYQPDIDPVELKTMTTLELSSSNELLLRLRWLAILAPIVRGSLAVTGGVHRPIDAVNAVMAGADAVQLVSALLHHGPRYLSYIVLAFNRWGSEHGYASVDEMRDRMALLDGTEGQALERGSYLRILQSWKKDGS